METGAVQINWDSEESHLLLSPKLPSGEKSIFESLARERADVRGHVWIASSGTTGSFPKIIGLPKTALLASAQGVNEFFGVQAEDAWALMLPTWHVGGLGIVVRARLAGVPCFEYTGAWKALDVARWLLEMNPSLVSLVPTQLFDFVSAGCRPPSRLRAAILGGAALDPDLRARAEDLGWPVVASFGMSEACSMIAAESFETRAPRIQRVLPHWEARLDAEGCLELKGAALFSWVGRWEQGRGAWTQRQGEWWRTSDRVVLSGRELRWLGRIDDFVKVKGEGVFLPQVAADLAAFLRKQGMSLRLAGVIPEESARTGMALVAAFEGDTPMAEQVDRLISEFNARRLSHEKIARWVCRQEWPRTELGKFKVSAVGKLD